MRGFSLTLRAFLALASTGVSAGIADPLIGAFPAGWLTTASLAGVAARTSLPPRPIEQPVQRR
eukprot:CAMPEP_0180217474 /NCGR_PEP_ID=MMETSP0987-20121128/16972_1 /TAXON_ID=697907 /ORGANISM="non described non described, Strain CCMP2293" /LENGTH=62 /DNA_ID=CAMNT_0022177049 /DNA_START=654 /DNA_END=838 /DNA_ORIENTATION=-